ncbi:OmpA/MotB family protein [Aquimarina muelleri]|uniref:Flagellar motor protein MotB n=1 Tax=Aquimarina muelleri TaxID=279356 RepID=A0A918N3G1_9FLAO|nr:OmpA family protein [Aquimarina muelleri]MCX2763916.1 OmpA family protein [Aquimarina muelleri]GGX11102.1 flagellar motor protein MotB [Aquimarina muelleri]
MKITILISILIFVLLTSCVSQKKYTDLHNRAELCEGELRNASNKLLMLENNLANEKNKSKALEKQGDYFKSTNTNLLDRLSDLSIVSKFGAESIKKSLEALNEQNTYIKDLTGSMQRKDSLNLALVMNLKRSLDDFDDEDISIEVKKGVVYVSISDRMLFKSGSYSINESAQAVIGKIAKIVNDHKELDILVEGHTDKVPIHTDCIEDNWDLSTKRATSIVRLMQTKFNVQPERMTAGGRSEFVPKATNETSNGRASNRRTEIIILPKLDQFFNLLTPPEVVSAD